MSESKYVSISLPAKFVEDLVDPFVSDERQGFSSRVEVIKAAVREFTKGRIVNHNEEAETLA